MWILFAAGSALFAGVTAILAKCGIRKTDSTVATAIRTLVVLAFAWTMVFVVGSQGEIRNIGPTTLFFLVLSGLATGASWLCYFKALQLGDINKVVPIDKSSTVLTILLAFFLLGEPIGLPQGIGVVLIGTGTFLMLEKRSPAAGCAPQCGSWMLYAFGSAVFASLTAILGKAGIQGVESNLGTAIRTLVVLAFAWTMVFVVGSQGEIRNIGPTTLFFLVLSGLATGASWLCYFKALQLGDINKVVPIDKSSTVLTILLAFFLLGEPIGLPQGIGVVLIGTGTFLMLEKRSPAAGCAPQCGSWMLYAFGSAVFASLTAILGKAGIQGVESNLGTAIRTGVVLVMAWLMVLVTGKAGAVRQVPRRELAFICLSGVATGASWLCYYRALQSGPASVVVPIDKLSILVTVAFSRLVFQERLTSRSAAGLALIVAGTLAMLF